MANGDTTSEAMALQKQIFFFSLAWCLLDIHLHSSFVVRAWSFCSRLVKHFAFFALFSYTLLSFFLSQENMLVVRKQWMLELGLSALGNFDPIQRN